MGFISKTITAISSFVSPEYTQKVNQNFDEFAAVSDPEIEAESVIEKALVSPGTGASGANHDSINTYKQLIYGKVSFDKPKRLSFYRNMAKFPEVSDAIDEICDACINYDENDNFVSLTWREHELSDEQIETIDSEFQKFISMYDVENNGWEYFHSLIRDGEVAFENIIDTNNPELGIVNVKRIPPECYEYLIDINYNLVGVLLNAKIVAMKHVEDMGKINMKECLGTCGELKDIQLRNSDSYSSRSEDSMIIPMPMTQLTLVNTGAYNSDKSVVYPVLETARRPYRQLILIEDAIIIYRLIRAPERLVFNVDTGKLPPSKAEKMVFQMMKRYQSKKVWDPSTGTVTNDYDPHQMLESYWFPKPDGSQGTTVNTLTGAQNLGELSDLHYFQKKLYVALKVPFSRTSDTPIALEKAETISYEEYRFAKFVMRLQNRFAKGLFDAFVTHLKLTGIWDSFELTKRNFLVKFTAPTSFELYEQQRLLNIKMENYNTATQDETFSKDRAKIKYLNWTEEEISRNAQALEHEMMRNALLNWKVQNIETTGSPYGPELEAAEEEGDFGDDFGAGAAGPPPTGGGFGDESPPDLGEEPPEAPESGGEEPPPPE